MSKIPFLVLYAERTESIPAKGRYDRSTQMVLEEDSRESRGIMAATMPTHIETGTGGHNDTDTDAVED